MKIPRDPSLKIALIPILFLVTMLSFNVYIFSDDSSYGPNQIALLVAALISGLLGVFYLKQDYKKLEKQAFDSIGVALPAVFILLVVGALIGVWILNGVVPAMIYYGIKLINPTIFLPVTLVICSIVSLATGSSWSTVGTVGIALIGIGNTLGIPEGMVAGAIVSGSYFGDKMSPLSDTTNLAPAMAGANLFDHIQHMLFTAGPAILISFFAFLGIGLFYVGDKIDQAQIDATLTLLDSTFNITPWLFTLPLIVFVMVYKKIPALPALLAGTVIGTIYVAIFQGELITSLMENFSLKAYYELVIKTLYEGFSSETGNAVVDKLLSRGGMGSMLNTVWLILMAMVFGGMMEATGMLGAIAKAVLKMVSGLGSLVAATVGSGIFLNLTTSDQYISIVVSGRMFKQAFDDYGLKPKNLSRVVEDSATVTSVLVPWNTCGAYFASIMGVATLTYLPFAFFNLLTPIISIILASADKTMERVEK
ncbi:MAG: Na+/H+ antiporter NhaC [Bacteriovoracaceae bacterium]|nr:Na+/H+ antiporter NhaC [Bacteriovoracaceae bacterium]